MSAPVAVIDIGSNTIKVLVAQRAADQQLVSLQMKTLEARISAGISHAQPRLTDEGFARGVAAVRELVADAKAHNPSQIVLVATSAVRDAANGAEFCDRIQSETGLRVRILSGEEEANAIGWGLTCDPALKGLGNFYLFDLGGGSLECLAFRDRKITQAISLPLGCVRLTERCVTDSAQALPAAELQEITETTREVLAKSGFHFSLPPEAVAVGAGGTLSTARGIIAARRGRTMETSDSLITLAELRELLSYISRCNLEDRRRIPGMPAGRADVMPAAIATLIAIAEMGGLEAYRHSYYNLRWGIADEALPTA